MKLTEAGLAQRRKNLQKIAEKRRAETLCRFGHKIDKVLQDGRRLCGTCNRDRTARSRTRVLIRLKLNKDDKSHGTKYGYDVGCRCKRCYAGYNLWVDNRRRKREAASN